MGIGGLQGTVGDRGGFFWEYRTLDLGGCQALGGVVKTVGASLFF
jgi:hypothetical protein